MTALRAQRAPCQYKDKSPRPSEAATVEGGQQRRPPEVQGTQAHGAAPAGTYATGKARAKRVGGPLVVPRHVRECQSNGARNWWIYCWRKDNPATKTRVPYSCNSWRCKHCARHEAAVTFARIKQATAPLEATGFVFGVLTIDRDGFYSPAGQPLHMNATEAYRALSRKSEIFLKRLRRWQKARGMTPLRSQWVAVVEAHRSGWPHVNFVIYSPELAAHLAAERTRKLAAGATEREAVLVADELRTIALASGWGPQSTLEQAKSIDALNGYVTKLAGMADATGGEIAKITQAPMTAPERFRRLRSGKGFLPKRHKNEDYTGTLIRRRINSLDGTPEAYPLFNPPLALIQEAARCSYLEEKELQQEQEQIAAKTALGRAAKFLRLRPPRIVLYAQAYAQAKVESGEGAKPFQGTIVRCPYDPAAVRASPQEGRRRKHDPFAVDS